MNCGNRRKKTNVTTKLQRDRDCGYVGWCNLVGVDSMIRCKLLNERAKIPARGRDGDAGFDLVYSGTETIRLQTGQQHAFETGVVLEIPYGSVGLIKPRSGLAVKFGIDTLAGVVDSNYRGEVLVILTKATTKGGICEIKQGDKIAQLVVQSCYCGDFREADHLTGSVRGEQGFGSSGR